MILTLAGKGPKQGALGVTEPLGFVALLCVVVLLEMHEHLLLLGGLLRHDSFLDGIAAAVR